MEIKGKRKKGFWKTGNEATEIEEIKGKRKKGFWKVKGDESKNK